MAKTKSVIVGLLALLITATAITVYLQGENVKIVVQKSKSDFYVFLNDTWQLGGTEYNYLYNGSKSISRGLTNINYSIDGNDVLIKREAVYGASKVVDTYSFKGDVADKELFPITHSIEIYNASGKEYLYKVSNLVYDGLTRDVSNLSSMNFGRNMKVIWQPGYKAKITNKGVLEVRYKIDSEYIKIENRLFDPTFTEPTFSGTFTNTNYNSTLGAIQLNSSLNNGSYFLSKDLGFAGTLNNVTFWKSYGYELPRVSLGESDVNVVNPMNMTGLVSYWNLNNNTNDYSGKGNNGLNKGVNCSLNVFGKFNTSCQFMGGSSFINVSDSDSLDLVNATTISAWIYPSELTSENIIVNKRIFTSEIYNYGFQTAGNQLKLQFYSGGYINHQTTNADLMFNTWYYVVGIFDWDNDRVYIYKDGILLLNESETSSPSINKGSLYIGTIYYNPTWYSFEGMIDELLVWNRTLSPTEIKNLYLRGATRLNLTITNGSQTITSDKSPVQTNLSGQVFNFTYNFWTGNTTYNLISPLLINYTLDYTLLPALLNISLGENISIAQWKVPYYTNTFANNVSPTNQTDSIGLWKIYNNGSVSGNVTLRFNDTYLGVITECSNNSGYANSIIVNTSDQSIKNIQPANAELLRVWCRRNYTYVATNCSQGLANVSTSCSSSSGTYGNSTAMTNLSYAYDANWDTFSQTAGATGYIYANYTIPSFISFSSTSTLQYKCEQPPDTVFSVGAWDYNSAAWSNIVTSCAETATAYNYTLGNSYLNGTKLQLRFGLHTFGGSYSKIYEASMFWYIFAPEKKSVSWIFNITN